MPFLDEPRQSLEIDGDNPQFGVRPERSRWGWSGCACLVDSNIFAAFGKHEQDDGFLQFPPVFVAQITFPEAKNGQVLPECARDDYMKCP